MNTDLILTAVGALGGLTIILSVLLVIANKKLYVFEDPRIDAVEDMLPHANCGACAKTGCRQFAEALVKSESQPGACTVASPTDHQAIADYLGVDVGDGDKVVARLACAGGTNVSRNRANYEGLETCRGAALVSGGAKDCNWGCMGLADCEVVCDFGAITMDEYLLPVVDLDKCTACGDCVDVCPKNLFSLHSVSHRLWVACKSLAEGDKVLEGCEVGCTACKRCEMDAPDGVVSIKRNLAVVDYSQNHQKAQAAIGRCPTGAIGWIDDKKGFTKGVGSKKVLRKNSVMPLASL